MDQNHKPSRKAAFRSFLRGDHAVNPYAAWLIFASYALLLLSRFIDTFLLTEENAYLSTILLQLLIFPIPTYLYIRLRGKALSGKLALVPPALSHLFLILSAILMLISGCTLLALICGMMNAQPSFTLYDTFSSIHDGTAEASIRLILAYGLLPAFCEELMFRSILCAEYEKHGILYASLLSSLFFAFLHFDLTALPVYLFAGLLLAAVRYVTRSAIASMIVHLGYNLFGIFVQAGLSGYCRSTGSIGLLVILLIALLLLSSAFFCGEVSRILKRRGTRSLLDDPQALSTPGLNTIPRKKWPVTIRNAFACPQAVGAVLLWLFGVILNLIK
ncbi:MAG: CPBP family intramembrane metalloprotease [Clostridia bacterium]|nr:CPBP family intramembrane metalloprotease [Clostridia bacterium]